MSVRARSWIGALSMLGAVLLLMTGGMIGGPLGVLVWPGAALLIVAFVLILTAFRRVSRDIGSSQARMEAVLRSEVDAGRERKKEPS